MENNEFHSYKNIFLLLGEIIYCNLHIFRIHIPNKIFHSMKKYNFIQIFRI